MNEEYFINQEFEWLGRGKKETKRGRIYILQMNTKFEVEDQQWNGISKEVERHMDAKHDDL